MNIDRQALRELMELLEEKAISEFEHEDERVRVRIVRGPLGGRAVHSTSEAVATSLSQSPQQSPQQNKDIVDVTSPFVGTFYRASTPEAAPLVQVGSIVRLAQPLCIIEAMKLMNEIESECSGTVIEVLVANGKAVEFGQLLFRIKKTD